MNDVGLLISVAGALVGFAIICDLVHKWKKEVERTKRSESDYKGKFDKQLKDNVYMAKKNQDLKNDLNHMKHMYGELFDVIKQLKS